MIEKKSKRYLVFKENALATNSVFSSYTDAKSYVEKNSTTENNLSIRNFTNRAILRKIRDIIGMEGTEASVLRLLDIVIEDMKN